MAKRSIKLSPVEDFAAQHVSPKQGRTLIAGSFIADGKVDRGAAYQDVLGVDMRPGPGVDLVLNLEDDLPADIGQFAHVECLSVLEHSQRPWMLAANLERLLEPGGTIHLSAPFVWRFHDYPSDFFRYTAEGVRSLFPGITWHALAYASNKLRQDHFLKSVEIAGHPYMPRCEVIGFGEKH